MYERRPTRWRDASRKRDDVFLPILTPWIEGERKVSAIETCYRALSPTWDSDTEDQIFGILFDIFRYRRYHATELPPIPPTVGEALADLTGLTITLREHDPDYSSYTFDEILDCAHPVPELEALLRHAKVLHNQIRWEGGLTRLQQVGRLSPDDFVVLLHPRTDEVRRFINRVRAQSQTVPQPPPPAQSVHPIAPFPALVVHARFRVLPRLEALAVYRGEFECTNEDLIRNSAYNWSPMTAQDIRAKTGIDSRRYTELELGHMALLTARSALRQDRQCTTVAHDLRRRLGRAGGRARGGHV
jgi:3-oxoacyl-[acyl-carrier-protein] synthase-3